VVAYPLGTLVEGLFKMLFKLGELTLGYERLA
jgi:hypothetical protein